MMDFSELMEIVWETKMRLGLSDASTATPSGYGEYFTNTLNIFAEFARKFSPRSFLDGLNAQFLSSYGRSLQVYVASVYNETLPRVALPVKRYLGDFDARAYWMRVRNDLENAANVAFESGHEMALKIRWTEPECLTWLIIASVVIIGFLMLYFTRGRKSQSRTVAEAPVSMETPPEVTDTLPVADDIEMETFQRPTITVTELNGSVLCGLVRLHQEAYAGLNLISFL